MFTEAFKAGAVLIGALIAADVASVVRFLVDSIEAEGPTVPGFGVLIYVVRWMRHNAFGDSD